MVGLGGGCEFGRSWCLRGAGRPSLCERRATSLCEGLHVGRGERCLVGFYLGGRG